MADTVSVKAGHSWPELVAAALPGGDDAVETREQSRDNRVEHSRAGTQPDRGGPDADAQAEPGDRVRPGAPVEEEEPAVKMFALPAFPHLCPGAACAICRWLVEHARV